MKNKFILILIALAFCSCEQQQPVTYISSMATYMFGSYSKNPGYEYYYVLDDSCVILPAGNSIDAKSILKDNSNVRVSVTFKWDDATYRRTQIEAEVVGLTIYAINKDIVNTSMPDTLGHDPADLKDTLSMWRCGGIEGAHTYLVVGFGYAFDDLSKNHNFNLSYDENIPPDEDGYYHVEFHHNAKKDRLLYPAVATGSFVLPHKFQEDGIKGLVVTFDGLDTLKSTVSYRYDYNPRKVTRIKTDE